ncbi:septum formation inhibitor Maf [Candidatus Methylospira mobilis]|uniref:dTTP/UTP pyrophosphatase n=1 Tax=Candidatus Methylospira mobilis TaxID=1808979 RepID=A0A5Q0BKB1_9GAMM|nr:Maf family protein [Candidatus Methylospira mobilis]QFY42661.1 septum formation inhibitor Maf [Candidatus Methylospira mobilis]
MSFPPVLILASTSPRRKALLEQIGVRHVVCPVAIDETPCPNEIASVYVQRMAADKAKAAHMPELMHVPVLAADTAVILNGNILGKPRDYDEACTMLQALSGCKHLVMTAIMLRAQDWQRQALSCTEITFNRLTSKEIEAYCRTDEPYDKAGGYGIQGMAAAFVSSISGSYSGVVGLPLFETAQLLTRAGVRWGLAT